MYEFVDLNETQNSYHYFSDEMQVNGQTLDTLIPGYQHLYVDGRNLVPQKVDEETIPGVDGVWINDMVNDKRLIVVTFLIDVSSSEYLRVAYTKLNDFLRSSDLLELKFADERAWTYEAVFLSADIPPEQSLNFIGQLEFLCPSPWKIKDIQESRNGFIELQHTFEVLPEKIIVTPNKNLNRLELRVRDKKIIFSRMEFPSGVPITLIWGKERFEATMQGRPILHYIDFGFYPEEFTIRDKNRVTAVDATVNLVKWRDRAL